jgi:hypothetical protein
VCVPGGERERVGLTEMLCGLGEDGEEDRMVTISDEGVDGERDKERLLRDSERGDRALCVAGLCLGMVPVRLLFLSASPGVDPDCWAVLVTVVVSLDAVEVTVVMVFSVVPVPVALDTVMVDLLPIIVTMMALHDSVRPITVEVGSGVGLSMACLSLKSVQPKTMFGTGSGSGVRDVEDALGDAVAAASGSVLLGGEILMFSKSGRIVWGSGMVGRIGRMGVTLWVAVWLDWLVMMLWVEMRMLGLGAL